MYVRYLRHKWSKLTLSGHVDVRTDEPTRRDDAGPCRSCCTCAWRHVSFGVRDRDVQTWGESIRMVLGAFCECEASDVLREKLERLCAKASTVIQCAGRGMTLDFRS